MITKNKSGRNPSGVTKLFILSQLSNKKLDTRELRLKLKRNSKYGKKKGSFDKSVFDNHIKDLEDMDLIEKIPQKSGLPHICKIKEINYKRLKKIYNLYGGSDKDFIQNRFINNNINDKLLDGFVKNETRNKSIYNSLCRNFGVRYGVDNKIETPDISKISDEFDIKPIEIEKKLVFPPYERKKIIRIIKFSPSSFNLIMNPKNILKN